MKAAAILALAVILASGCASSGRIDTREWEPAKLTPKNLKWSAGKYKYWEPDEVEKKHGDDLASAYARSKLKATKKRIATMDREFLAFYWNEQPVLIVGFFDRERFPEGSTWPNGGFPHFFNVWIDPVKWRVIKHYADRE